jgi:hypothetical protein
LWALDPDEKTGNLSGVNWFQTGTAILMLALWGPMQSHCLLERTGMVPSVLECGTDSFGATENHEPETQCCAFEKPIYQAVNGRVTVSPPLVLFLSRLIPLENAHPTVALSPGSFTAAPPGIAVSWQFDLRVAMLPRAPSPAS